jgi:hypothetical protein
MYQNDDSCNFLVAFTFVLFSDSNIVKLRALVLWSHIPYDFHCHKVCQWLAAGRWFSSGTQVSYTNKIDRHDITEILLKVVLDTINLMLTLCFRSWIKWFQKSEINPSGSSNTLVRKYVLYVFKWSVVFLFVVSLVCPKYC